MPDAQRPVLPRRRKEAAALILLDVINLFDFEGGGALARQTAGIVPALVRLRRRFTAAGAAVIYVNDNFGRWRSDFRELVATCSHPDSAGAAIARALAPDAGHYFVLKPRHSAFLGTPLDVLLAQLATERLVVAGIAADACVLATVTDAKARGYQVQVPRDAVASRTAALRRDALSLLSRSGAAQVLSASRIRVP